MTAVIILHVIHWIITIGIILEAARRHGAKLRREDEILREYVEWRNKGEWRKLNNDVDTLVSTRSIEVDN